MTATRDDTPPQGEAPRDAELELIRPFLPEDVGPGQATMLQLAGEIEYGILSVTDLSLARSKLAWWGTELARLMEGEARHPVTRQLTRVAETSLLSGGELSEILEGLRMCLEGRIYNDEDEMLLHCWRREGALSVGISRLAGATSEAQLATARDLGIGRGLARILTRFDEDRDAGRCWLAEPLIRAANLSPEALLREAPDAAQRREMLTPLADMAEARLSEGLEQMTELEVRRPLIAAALRAVAAQHALKRARKRQFEKLYSIRERGIGGGVLKLWRSARRFAQAQ